VFVHWTRVIHLPNVDNRINSPVMSISRMQQCLNRLLDIRKISAASAEGYWKSCFATISAETNPSLGGDVKIDTAGLDQMFADFYAGLRRTLITRGMTMKTLAPSVVDPTGHLDKHIEAVCIKIACPIRVFKGSERGELASGQDDSKWNDVLRARELLHVTPMVIVPFINRLILLGVLPEPKDGYTVVWPDRESVSDKDKAGLALTITQAISAYIAGNAESKMPYELWLLKAFDGYFTKDEIGEMVKEAEKMAEKQLEAQADQADQAGGQLPQPGDQPPKPGQPGQPPQQTPQQQQAAQAAQTAKAKKAVKADDNEESDEEG
jgi:hypothetical protein